MAQGTRTEEFTGENDAAEHKKLCGMFHFEIRRMEHSA